MGFIGLGQWALSRVGLPRRGACSLFLVFAMRFTNLRWIDLVFCRYC